MSSFNQNDLAEIEFLQPEGWPDITPHIQFYLNSTFCFPLKIEIDNHIAGIGTLIKHDDVAWLAHIIVHTDYRNKGIGTSITKALLELADHHKCKTVLLIATTLGQPVYKKLGFILEAEYVNFKGELISKTETSTVIPYHPKYETDILTLDQSVTGELRVELLKQHFAEAKLVVENNKLLGYYLPTLGEGLIVAETPLAGQEFLTLKLNHQNKTVIPADNKAGVDFLKAHGMVEHSRVSRMYMGRKLLWQPEKIYSRIGGNMG